MNHDHIGDFLYDAILDPSDDHEPWHVVKVYRDGNPLDRGRFKTEEEADDFIVYLETLDKVFAS
jgi:hypothetical protein